MRKNTLALISILLVLCFLVSCQDRTQDQQELISYLDDLGEQYEAICVEMGIANWNLYSKEGEADQDAPKRKYAELLLNPEHLEIVDNWLEQIDNQADPRLHRRLQVWKDVLTAAKVDMNIEIFKLENALEKEITDYKHDVGGEMVPHRQLRRALNNVFKDPAERNQKYTEYITKMQETFEPRVLELMRLRNAKSKEEGFDDYGHLCLYMMGLLPDGTNWFYDVLDLIDQKTLAPYKAILTKAKEKSGEEVITPGVLRKSLSALRQPLPRKQVAPAADPMDLTKETLMNIGFNLEEMPIRIAEENIPYGGLGLAIKVPTDHRIVVQKGRGSVGLFLHEIGHGVQAVYITWPEPIFKNYEWCLGASSPAFDEGVANILAGFTAADKWQAKYYNKSDERLAAEKANRNAIAPYSIRSQIASFLFEIELYKNLDRDAGEVRRDLQKRWLLLESPSSLSQNWATSVFPVAYPIYGQNYFLASIVTWQVHDYLKENFGEDYVFNTEISTWIKKYLCQMGHGTSWPDRVEKATGKQLDINAWLASQGIF